MRSAISMVALLLLVVATLVGADTSRPSKIIASLRNARSITDDVPASSTGSKVGPSISATQKPPCPSYIRCPYPPYPAPTTKNPAQTSSPSELVPVSETSNPPLVQSTIGPEGEKQDEVKPVKKPSNVSPVSGQVPSATQKPPCPSYIHCPYPPYPAPTTKKPSEPSSTTEYATGNEPSNPTLDEYMSPSPGENQAASKPVKTEPSNASQDSGPVVSATKKPPCPSYIHCPYPPYPAPTTKKPSEPSSTTEYATGNEPSNPTLDEYMSPSPGENQAASNPVKTEPSNASQDSGPVVSATKKPPCPSYIHCPYPPYPAPTTKSPTEASSTTESVAAIESSDPTLDEYMSASEGDGQVAPKPVKTKPSIILPVISSVVSATSAPHETPCSNPSECSHENPEGQDDVSTTETSHTEESSSLLLVEYIGESDNQNPPKVNQDENVHPEPSVEETSESVSISTQPDSEPTKTDSANDDPDNSPISGSLEQEGSALESSTSKVNGQSSMEPNGDEKESHGSENLKFPEPSNGQVNTPVSPEQLVPYDDSLSADAKPSQLSPSKDSISATQKPQCPSYLSCPWEYPKPFTTTTTTTTPPTEISTQKAGLNSVNELSASKPSISATQKPQCPSYASCPWEYPKPITTPANSAFESSEKSTIGEQMDTKDSEAEKPSDTVDNTGNNAVWTTAKPSVELANQGAYLPIYSYLYGFGDYGQGGSYFSNSRPGILNSQLPVRPSYLVNVWEYSRPSEGSVLPGQNKDNSIKGNEISVLNGVNKVGNNGIASQTV